MAEDLTFNAVDDLVGAHIRGRLDQSPTLRFTPRAVGPLVELIFQSAGGQFGPIRDSRWLDQHVDTDLR